jgi:hypothetical protein
MENKFMESDDYNLRGPPCAFFQMGYGNESGPAMIEFFNPNKQDAQKFVDYVNNQLKG